MQGLKLAGAAVLASVSACAAALIALYGLAASTHTAWPSGEDVRGFALLSFGSGLVLAFGVYLPVAWLAARLRRVIRTPALVTSLVLNTPAWIGLAAGTSHGTFGGITEVLVFGISYLVAGLVFVRMGMPPPRIRRQ